MMIWHENIDQNTGTWFYYSDTARGRDETLEMGG
jgi:hypothetical protein